MKVDVQFLAELLLLKQNRNVLSFVLNKGENKVSFLQASKIAGLKNEIKRYKESIN